MATTDKWWEEDYASPVQGAGGGRGSVNPTPVSEYSYNAAPQRQYQVSAPQAAAEGTARGLTAGTFDYLPAGMAYAYDRIRKKLSGSTARPLSFDEALAATRAHTADTQQQHPLAYAGGNVGGSVALAYATGGQSLIQQAATQATIGAIEEAATNPNATTEDIIKAGGTGALVTGTLGVVGKGATSLVKGAVEKKMATQMASRNANIERDIAKGTATRAPFASVDEYAAQQAQKPLFTLAKSQFRPAINQAAQMVSVPALASGAAYYAADQMPGLGISPTTAAVLAGGGLAASKGKLVNALTKTAPSFALNVANKYPNLVPATMDAARAIGSGTANAVQNPVYQPPAQDNWWEEDY